MISPSKLNKISNNLETLNKEVITDIKVDDKNYIWIFHDSNKITAQTPILLNLDDFITNENENKISVKHKQYFNHDILINYKSTTSSEIESLSLTITNDNKQPINSPTLLKSALGSRIQVQVSGMIHWADNSNFVANSISKDLKIKGGIINTVGQQEMLVSTVASKYVFVNIQDDITLI